MELQETFVLSPISRTLAAAGKHQHQRILSLQGGELAVVPAMAGKPVVGEGCAGNYAGSHATDYDFLSFAKSSRASLKCSLPAVIELCA
jgi:hypothetical protein